jgi:hypothetical protein
MRQDEAAAHQLVDGLSRAGIDARVIGEGVHWRVEVVPAGSRTLIVHCFWYERQSSGLVLGMGLNPSNARSRLRAMRAPPPEGAQYLAILGEDGAHAADGRTSFADDILACAGAWIGGATLDAVVLSAPFVDQRRRAARRLAEQLPSGLRREISGDPAYELWVYGENRACKVEAGDGTVSSALLLGQAQVAFAAEVEDFVGAVTAWLIDGVSIRELVERAPSVEMERHAEVLEVDPARWNWLHLRDRMLDAADVLAPLRALIAALATSPVCTKFFTFSSLSRLCFSASSHYPWVNKGLPPIGAHADGRYWVGSTSGDLPHAVESIEAMLATYPVPPFFGSAPHHELPLLAACLAQRGSKLRPRLVQHRAFYALVVDNGPRRCDVSDRSVTFVDGARRHGATYPSLEEAAGSIVQYLEGGVAMDDLGLRERQR